MQRQLAVVCSGKLVTASACLVKYYYSPDPLSSGIKSYEEANAGARYTIMRPVSIEAGYRYLNLAGKNGNRDNAIADGPYVGVNASF
ncbi:YfaZ family outer membrane protein [Shigella sonnei]